MVRLKVGAVRAVRAPEPQFQFHNGSIKREIINHQNGTLVFVSIPQWFD